MPAAAVLDLLLTALEHTQTLAALYQTANAEGRDLTPAEVAQVQSSALASISKLAAATA